MRIGCFNPCNLLLTGDNTQKTKYMAYESARPLPFPSIRHLEKASHLEIFQEKQVRFFEISARERIRVAPGDRGRDLRLELILEGYLHSEYPGVLIEVPGFCDSAPTKHPSRPETNLPM